MDAVVVRVCSSVRLSDGVRHYGSEEGWRASERVGHWQTVYLIIIIVIICCHRQWLKCNRAQGKAVIPHLQKMAQCVLRPQIFYGRRETEGERHGDGICADCVQ